MRHAVDVGVAKQRVAHIEIGLDSRDDHERIIGVNLPFHMRHIGDVVGLEAKIARLQPKADEFRGGRKLIALGALFGRVPIAFGETAGAGSIAVRKEIAQGRHAGP